MSFECQCTVCTECDEDCTECLQIMIVVHVFDKLIKCTMKHIFKTVLQSSRFECCLQVECL